MACERASHALLIAACLLSSASAAAEPTVDKHLKPHTWKWTPNLRLKISGPISSSSTISVEYTLPNGKPWNKVECENVSETGDTEYLTLSDCGYRLEESLSRLRADLTTTQRRQLTQAWQFRRLGDELMRH